MLKTYLNFSNFLSNTYIQCDTILYHKLGIYVQIKLKEAKTWHPQ